MSLIGSVVDLAKAGASYVEANINKEKGKYEKHY